jgi:hypothetical protein
LTDDLLQRLPDALENSRDNGMSDEEERLNIFGTCDININELFESAKSDKA